MSQLHSPVYDEDALRRWTAYDPERIINESSYVPFPCILSSRECECKRAAPLILSPSENSGDPPGGCLGESED
jgi:hypothetical protein